MDCVIGYWNQIEISADSNGHFPKMGDEYIWFYFQYYCTVLHDRNIQWQQEIIYSVA